MNRPTWARANHSTADNSRPLPSSKRSFITVPLPFEKCQSRPDVKFDHANLAPTLAIVVPRFFEQDRFERLQELREFQNDLRVWRGFHNKTPSMRSLSLASIRL